MDHVLKMLASFKAATWPIHRTKSDTEHLNLSAVCSFETEARNDTTIWTIFVYKVQRKAAV